MSKLPHEEPDPPISDEVLVYRLIPTHWCDVIDGQWVFQSAAFDNASPENSADCPEDMSVVLGDTLASLQRAAEGLPAELPWAGDRWGVAALKVQYLRHDEHQIVLRTPEEEEPAHGDVCGKKNSKRRRRLKTHAWWVIQPPAAPEPA